MHENDGKLRLLHWLNGRPAMLSVKIAPRHAAGLPPSESVGTWSVYNVECVSVAEICIRSYMARVVKLVDTADLKSAAYLKRGVPVQVRPRAPVRLYKEVVTNILRSHFRNFRNHFRSFRNHFRNPSLFRRLYRFADASINCVGYLFVGVAE